MFKRWSTEREGLQILGREVQPKLAQGIFEGTVYPRAVARLPLSHWWDDLTDLEHKGTTREGSAKLYGRNFTDAQDIIRGKLSES